MTRLDMEIVCFLPCLSWPHLDGDLVQKNFVKIVRAVEITLGIPIDGAPQNFLDVISALPSTNFIAALDGACQSKIFNDDVTAALLDAIPILSAIGPSYDLQDTLTLWPFDCHDKEPIVTK